MQTCWILNEPATQSVVDYIDFIRILVLAHAKISWFDISMYVLSIVDESENFDDFNAKSQYSEYGKSVSVLRQLDQGL